MTKILSLLVLFLFLSSCSINPVTGNPDFVLISEEQEISLGRNVAKQVLQQERKYEDESLQRYIQELGDDLTKRSHRPNLIYRFTVLDNPAVNAFALPGGHIFIYRGLLAHFNSEEELAAVLAHEIGHVTARHSVRQYSQSQATQILTTIIGQEYGSTAADLSYLMGGALISGYGRDMELEADGLAVQYSSISGYSGNGMMSALRVLKAQEEYSVEVSKRRGVSTQTYHGVFATHPENDKRLKEVVKQNEIFTNEASKEDRLFSFLNGLVYGDSSREGVRRGNNFYHADLGIFLSAPRKWEMINNRNNLLFISPNGKAQVKVSMDDQSRVETPKQYLQRITNQKIQNGKTISSSGYEGYSATVKFRGKDALVAVIFRKKEIFLFTSGSEDLQISNFVNEFNSIISSFRDLKRNELKLAESLKIKIYKVKKGDTYSSLSDKSPISYDPESKLRLLNGDYPDGKLLPGRLIKIVD